MERLLAKSGSREDAFLPNHVTRVMEAAEVVLARAVPDLFASLGADLIWQPSFMDAVRWGAYLHDWGKANDGFQEMVQGKRRAGKPQAARHEGLSLLLSLEEKLAAWLASRPSGVPAHVLDAARIAAAGHHLKFPDRQERDGAGSYVRLLCGHRDFRGVLAVGSKRLGLAPPPETRDCEWRTRNALRERLDEAQGRLDEALEREPEEWRRLVPFIKGLVVAADVAGSACGASRKSAEDLQVLDGALARVASADTWEEVVRHRLAPRGKPTEFQRAVAASGSRTLVRAGCGSGKTVAAYLWAQQQAVGRKLFFCYPTTGTATEGFRDYALDVGPVTSRLMHSRAEVDLVEILGTGDESEDELDVRLASLAGWDPELVVCTVDLVLGLVHNQRRGLFTLPAFARAAFVFDEVHAFDSRMWASLLRLLEALPGAPVLLMSASLPRGRREELRRRFPRLREVLGPQDWENLPRYRLEPVTTQEDALERALAAYDRGERVLWVCNTVDRAIEVGRQAEARGAHVMPYHSRYRYLDRVQRHQELISRFRAEKDACFAVTTQVAEMSLDLSAQLLVTELAPVPGLIQRLGRLNRRATPAQPGTPAPALALRPPRALPYEEENIEAGADFWQSLVALGRPLSQRDLHEALERMDVPEDAARVESVFLDRGAESPQAVELRETGATFPFLREEDLAGFATIEERLAQAKLLEIPMTVPREGFSGMDRLGYRRIAPAGTISYDQRWGAKWAK